MPLGENVVPDRLDLFQDTAVNPHQSPQRSLAVGVDKIQQGRTLRIILPGSARFEPHEFSKDRTCGVTPKMLCRATEPREILFRKIDASHRIIFRNIPKYVCELKCDAQLWCELQGG